MKAYIYLTLTFLFFLFCFEINAQLFNEDDKDALRGFLRQPSSINGKINAECLGLSLSDTLNWNVSENWIVKLQEPSALAYLDWEWDTNAPVMLSRLEIKTFDDSNSRLSGTLDCSKFTRLEYLDCSNSEIAVLDVSTNNKLRYLNCSANKLKELSVSQSGLLSSLDCSNNQLSNLSLSNNLNLSNLNCSNNLLVNLDISINPNISTLACSHNKIEKLVLPANSTLLESLDCSGNLLSNLSVSDYTNLKLLACDDNKLKNVDVSQNSDLVSFYLLQNQFENLDVSQNRELLLLNASKNKLTDLDLSANSELEYLYCFNNELGNLDISANSQLHTLNSSYNELSEIITNPLTNPFISLICNNNNLLFSSMPVNLISSETKTLKYSPQGELDGGELYYNNLIDLSKEYNIKNNTSSFSWGNIAGEHVLMNNRGEGLFSASVNEDNIYICNITNSFFPELTLKYKVSIKKDTITNNINDKYDNHKLTIISDKNSGMLLIKGDNIDLVKSVNIYDTLGRQVHYSNESSVGISVHTLQSGVYIVKLTMTSGTSITQKISF